ncbi:MAG: hypothetical protein KME15_16405 [Drouetiella hepatica Uher 2000/2452]|jgi:hypothetical protein|uniref:Uncharacterized protein n=1 Tax=Drouetiella hepatica Uher 2000/2452 TaxID=904376 RepID=A0A951QF63_9CYAN|nr:hypothetical protein [Drouetiella hepatica Uher 2000/2452]
MAIEEDSRNLNQNAGIGEQPDLSQSFAPREESAVLNQGQLNQGEVIFQIKQDLTLLLESLGIMREKFKIVSNIVNQQSMEETEFPAGTSTKGEKSLADLLDDCAADMRDVMIELIGESVEKTGARDLYEAVTEMETAFQTTVRLQQLAETLYDENINH